MSAKEVAAISLATGKARRSHIALTQHQRLPFLKEKLKTAH